MGGGERPKLESEQETKGLSVRNGEPEKWPLSGTVWSGHEGTPSLSLFSLYPRYRFHGGQS